MGPLFYKDAPAQQCSSYGEPIFTLDSIRGAQAKSCSLNSSFSSFPKLMECSFVNSLLFGARRKHTWHGFIFLNLHFNPASQKLHPTHFWLDLGILRYLWSHIFLELLILIANFYHSIWFMLILLPEGDLIFKLWGHFSLSFVLIVGHCQRLKTSPVMSWPVQCRVWHSYSSFLTLCCLLI